MKTIKVSIPNTDAGIEILAAFFKAKPRTVFVIEGGWTTTTLEGTDEDIDRTEALARAMGIEVVS